MGGCAGRLGLRKAGWTEPCLHPSSCLCVPSLPLTAAASPLHPTHSRTPAGIHSVVYLECKDAGEGAAQVAVQRMADSLNTGGSAEQVKGSILQLAAATRASPGVPSLPHADGPSPSAMVLAASEAAAAQQRNPTRWCLRFSPVELTCFAR